METVHQTNVTPESLKVQLRLFAEVLKTVRAYLPTSVPALDKVLSFVDQALSSDWLSGLIAFLTNAFHSTSPDKVEVAQALRQYADTLQSNQPLTTAYVPDNEG
jgi:hypothetical protein